MEKKSLINNAIFNMIYKLLNVLFPLISSAYISRIILADGIGKVSYAQNIVSYFTMVAALGIPSYGIREIAKSRNNHNELNKTFTELFCINFISTFLCVFIYYIFILSFQQFQKEITLHLIFGLLIVFNFINVDWFYQGMEDYVYISIRSIIIKFLSLVLLFLFVKDRNDYIIYAIITCLATGGNYIYNIFHLRKYISFQFHDINLLNHMKPILLLVVCSISTELYSKIDVTMLGSNYDERIVGYYTNAQKLITVIVSITSSLSSVFLPRLSYYYINEEKKFNDLISKGLNILFYISIPSCLGILLISNNLIPAFFGSNFNPAVLTVQILSPLIIIKSVGDLLCYQINIATNNERKLLYAYSAAAIINIVLNSIFIPIYFDKGAAFASVISELVVNISLSISSLKMIKIKMSKKNITSIIYSSIALICVVSIINLLKINSVIILMIQVVCGIIVYLTISLLTHNEFALTMIQYIKNKIHLPN